MGPISLRQEVRVLARYSPDEELGKLLPYVVERCEHIPPKGQDGPAVCHVCENVITVLVDRIDHTGEPLH